MRSWLRNGVVGMGLLALAGSSLSASHASAQATERYRVMVTNLKPADRTDKDFGKDLAKELRDLINQLPTHQPVEEREVRDAANRFDIEYDELDCIQSLQLASQVNAQAVFCGSVTENRDDRTFALTDIQFAVPGESPFTIDDKTWGRDDAELAAQEIASAFDTFVTQSRRAVFCGEDFESQNWESAEQNCLGALEINPDHVQVLFVYANVLQNQDRLEEAYARTQRVMELDPLHEQALQLAGYLAAQLGLDDAARQHYADYLMLNPGNANVRMRVAYDLAQAGDPEGAMILMEEGLELEADNVDLLIQHASFATAAAQDRMADAEPGSPLSMETAVLFQKAQQSYRAAYEVRGIEMDTRHLRNMIATLNELGQVDEAVTMTEQVLETHDEPDFWSLYADLLRKLERTEDALTALEELGARDADYRNLRPRRGQWLVEAGREDEALPVLQEAVQNGEQSADDMARIFFAFGVNEGIQGDPKDLDYALSMIAMAKSFGDELSVAAAGELDFWHGYALYEQATEQERPQTLQTARLTLPKFQEAARLFALPGVADYANGPRHGREPSAAARRHPAVHRDPGGADSARPARPLGPPRRSSGLHAAAPAAGRRSPLRRRGRRRFSCPLPAGSRPFVPPPPLRQVRNMGRMGSDGMKRDRSPCSDSSRPTSARSMARGG